MLLKSCRVFEQNAVSPTQAGDNVMASFLCAQLWIAISNDSDRTSCINSVFRWDSLFDLSSWGCSDGVGAERALFVNPCLHTT